MQVHELEVLKTKNGELMEANSELQAKNVTLQQAAKNRPEERDPLKVTPHPHHTDPKSAALLKARSHCAYLLAPSHCVVFLF